MQEMKVFNDGRIPVDNPYQQVTSLTNIPPFAVIAPLHANKLAEVATLDAPSARSLNSAHFL
jgi:hypothetical protein